MKPSRLPSTRFGAGKSSPTGPAHRHNSTFPISLNAQHQHASPLQTCSRQFSWARSLAKPVTVAREDETLGERIKRAGKMARAAPNAIAAKRAMDQNDLESQHVTFANPDSITGKATSWQQAVAEAEKLVQQGGSVINPTQMLGKDLQIITQQIRRLLGSGHPVLSTISNYYFSQGGKHIRPLIVLLMSMATSVAPKLSSASPT